MKTPLPALCALILSAIATGARAQAPCSTLKECERLAKESILMSYSVNVTDPNAPVLVNTNPNGDKFLQQIVPPAGTIATIDPNSGAAVLNPNPKLAASNFGAMDLPSQGLIDLRDPHVNPTTGYTIMVTGFPTMPASSLSPPSGPSSAVAPSGAVALPITQNYSYGVYASLLNGSDAGALVSLGYSFIANTVATSPVAFGSAAPDAHVGPGGGVPTAFWALGKHIENGTNPDQAASAYFEHAWDPAVTGATWQDVYYTFTPDGRCRIDVFIPSIDGNGAFQYSWMAGFLNNGHPNALQNTPAGQVTYPAGKLGRENPPESSLNPANEVRWPARKLMLGDPLISNPTSVGPVGTVGETSYGGGVDRATGFGGITVFGHALSTDELLSWQNHLIASDSLRVGEVPCNSGKFLNAIAPNGPVPARVPANPCGYTASNWETGRTVAQGVFSSQRLDFRDRSDDSSAERQILILTNYGQETLNVLDLSLTGNDAGNFILDSRRCGISLASNKSCEIAIRFEPVRHGRPTAQLVLRSNTPGPAPAVTLNGERVAASRGRETNSPNPSPNPPSSQSPSQPPSQLGGSPQQALQGLQGLPALPGNGATGFGYDPSALGSASCNAGSSGDPLSDASTACDTSSNSSQDPPGVSCAQEGEVCAFEGSGTISFGVHGHYVTKQFTNVSDGVTCDKDSMGEDPIEGESKSCFLSVP